MWLGRLPTPFEVSIQYRAWQAEHETSTRFARASSMCSAWAPQGVHLIWMRRAGSVSGLSTEMRPLHAVIPLANDDGGADNMVRVSVQVWLEPAPVGDFVAIEPG